MDILLTALASTGFFSLIQFLIKRRDEKKGKFKQLTESIEGLKKKIDKQERDSCRTQLLFLMAFYPDNTGEILKVAEHYFKDLKANWYMTSLFAAWCKKRGIELPDWAIGLKEDDK